MRFREALQYFNLSPDMATLENIETTFRAQTSSIKRKLAEEGDPAQQQQLQAELDKLQEAKDALVAGISARAEASGSSGGSKPLVFVVIAALIGILVWLFLPSSKEETVTPPKLAVAEPKTVVAEPIIDDLELNDRPAREIEIRASNFDLEKKIDSEFVRQQRTNARRHIREVTSLLEQWNSSSGKLGVELPGTLEADILQARQSYDQDDYQVAEQQYASVIERLNAALSGTKAATQAYTAAVAKRSQWAKVAAQSGYRYRNDKSYVQQLRQMKSRLAQLGAADVESIQKIQAGYSSAIANAAEMARLSQNQNTMRAKWLGQGGDLDSAPAVIKQKQSLFNSLKDVSQVKQLAVAYSQLDAFYSQPPSVAPVAVSQPKVEPPSVTPPPVASTPAPVVAVSNVDIQRVIEDSINDTIRISTGSYYMGGEDAASPLGKIHFPVASPPHRVKVRSFRMAITEVTFDHYDVFAKDTKRALPGDNGWGRGDMPVINVSYNDAVAYTQWLSKKSARSFRLPSEAEWEYVAWSNSDEPELWKQRIDKEGANCKGCSTNVSKPVVVKQHKGNGWGIKNIAGNVAEWTQDCWNKRYDGAPKTSAPWAEGECDQRVVRGSSWNSDVKYLHPAFREALPRTTSNNTTGFRLVLN